MVDMDVMLDSKSVVDRSADLGFTYISLENHKDMNLVNSITLQPQKRSFSRTKRVRDGKGSRSISNLSKSRQRSLDSDCKESMNWSPVSSNSNSQEIKTDMGLSHSSSSLSNSIPESKISSRNSVAQGLENPETKSSRENINRGCSVFNSGLYLLLISLTVTVLWGRICAILFTSIWVYFLPCWNHNHHHQQHHHRPESVRKWPERDRDMKDCNKKRVIMEVLLQRKQSSRGH